MQRRNIILAGITAAGAVAIFMSIFLPKSEEELVEGQLHGLAEAVGFSEPIANPVFWGSALAGRLEPFTTEQLDVSVEEVQRNPPRERGQLAIAAAMALTRYGSLDVSLSDLEITLLGEGARVRAWAEVRATEAGQLKADRRRIVFQLDKRSGDYLVSSVQVERPNPQSHQ